MPGSKNDNPSLKKIFGRAKSKLNPETRPERVDKAKNLLTNSQEWTGHPEKAEELENILYRSFTGNIRDIKYSKNEVEDIKDTFSRILERDPHTADVFRNVAPIDVDWDNLIEERVDELLKSENEDKAVKEAFTVIHETSYEPDSDSRLFDDENYFIDLNEGRTVTKQLSDSIFSRLDSPEAKAFFDYARRDDAPRGFHTNFHVDADPAEDKKGRKINHRGILRKEFEKLKPEIKQIEDISDIKQLAKIEDVQDARRKGKSIIEELGLEYNGGYSPKDITDEAEIMFDIAYEDFLQAEELSSSSEGLFGEDEYRGGEREGSSAFTEAAGMAHRFYLQGRQEYTDKLNQHLDNIGRAFNSVLDNIEAYEQRQDLFEEQADLTEGSSITQVGSRLIDISQTVKQNKEYLLKEKQSLNRVSEKTREDYDGPGLLRRVFR